jgi:hypothetical protein
MLLLLTLSLSILWMIFFVVVIVVADFDVNILGDCCYCCCCSRYCCRFRRIFLMRNVDELSSDEIFFVLVPKNYNRQG